MSSPKSAAVLVYVDRYSSDVFSEFINAVGGERSAVRVERVPTPGPMAGVEWLLPTAVVLFLGKAYFDGFLKEMGKDHYMGLRSGVGTLWKALVAPEREIQLRMIGSEGKIDPDSPYSNEFSIYTETHDGRRIKFLFASGTTREEYLRAVNAVLDAVQDYHSGNPRSFLHRQIVSAIVPRSPYLIRFDPEKGHLALVDVLPSRGVRESSE
ncbi:MAG TPA: hypothetical protein VF613_11575 [Longimicrobium sp.]|jgi:hypothetical protein